MKNLLIKNAAARLKSLTAVAAGFFYSFARGKATRMVPNPQTFAVVQNSKLGDMVCMTPIFRAIKKNFPKARVVVAGSPINKELLLGNTDVDGYLTSKKGELVSTIRALKALKLDVAIVPAPDFYSLAAAYLAGVPCIVAPRVENGWSPNETRAYKWFARRVLTASHTMGNYAPREYLRLLEPLGVNESDTTKHLAFGAEAGARAKAALPEGTMHVGISVGAGNAIKKWKNEEFAKVAAHLIERYAAHVVLLGDSKDVADSAEVARLVGASARVTDLSGKLSIDELKAHISRLSLFVSVDTGPIYIAEAFGVPTVDIVGPMDENEQPPRGPRNVVVVPQGRSAPELHILNARVYNLKNARAQAESITSAQVIEAVDKLMANPNK